MFLVPEAARKTDFGNAIVIVIVDNFGSGRFNSGHVRVSPSYRVRKSTMLYLSCYPVPLQYCDDL